MATRDAQPGMPKKRSASGAAGDDVPAFLDALEHPFKREVVALRAIILEADPAIAEGIKWNVPSFRTTEYFATMHLRMKDGVGVILHFGAKKTAASLSGVEIADPSSLLEWLAKDRAMVSFRDVQDIEDKQAAFSALLRAWIRHVA